jgi:hypothetical protein
MKKAYKDKDQLIGEEISKALKRAKGRSEKDRDVKCANDDFIRREILLAEKEKRAPEPQSRAMYDEV